MNQRNNLFLPLFGILTLSACVKTEIIPETLAPQLNLSPDAVSLTVGKTFQLNGLYTDETGQDQSAQIQWITTAPAIASVNASGILTAKIPGQARIIATAPGGLSDSALVTVTAGNNAVAKVVVTNSQTVLDIGATLQLSAKSYDGNNQEIAVQIVNWESSNSGVLSVDSGGLVTGLSAGQASVTASVAGVSSLPLLIRVMPPDGLSRIGTFSGNSGYSVKGSAALQQTSNALTLKLGSDFSASNGPMLGVYLAKNAAGNLTAQNGLKLDNLNANSGAQEYAVPAGTGLYDYNYVVIYCIPFNVRFGTAALGQ